MKKAIVLLLALVVVGAFAFAQDAAAAPAKDQPAYEFSANATGGWTTNLDAKTSTFINDWDVSLKYHLLNDVAKTTGGDSGTYGLIEVTHLNLNLIEETETTVGSDTATWGDGANDGTGDNLSVSAKIVSGAMELGLYGAPDTNFENAKYIPLFSKDSGYTNDSGFKPTLASSKGLTFKYGFGDMGSIKLMAANTAPVAAGTTTTVYTLTQNGATVLTVTAADAAAATYKDLNGTTLTALGTVAPYGYYLKLTPGTAVAEVKAHYLVGGLLALNPVKDVLALTAGGWYDLDNKGMIFSATANVTAGALTVAGAFDGQKNDGADLQFDASANVAYSLFEKKDSVNLDFYYLNDKVVDAAKIGGGTHRGDLGLKFVDAGGFVEPLSFTVGAFAQDLLLSPAPDPKEVSVAESVSYKVGDLTPNQALRYDLFNKGMYLKLACDYAGIKNTVVTASFEMGASKDDGNYVLTGGKDSKDKVITLKAKVTL